MLIGLHPRIPQGYFTSWRCPCNDSVAHVSMNVTLEPLTSQCLDIIDMVWATSYAFCQHCCGVPLEGQCSLPMSYFTAFLEMIILAIALEIPA